MRSNDLVVWIGAVLMAVMFGVLAGFGASGVTVLMLVVLGLVFYGSIGRAMRSPMDSDWIAKWVVAGFVVKVLGSLARYYMVAVFYSSGDSYGYYRAAIDIASQWHSGRVPSLSGSGGFGAQIVELVAGSLFAIFTPDMLGGFLMFAILAYGGQLFFYAAFRQWAKPNQLKPYAFLILALPTYSFWPSSIGKDALVILGLGAATYYLSKSLVAFEVRWLFGMGVSLAALGFIRVHIAALVGASLALAALIARRRPDMESGASLRRILVLLGAGGATLLALQYLPRVIGIDVLSGDIEVFASDLVRRTSDGTVASGGPVTSIQDIPAALALSLFRPFAWEASEIQHFFAAAETTLIGALFVWRLPSILKHWRLWRRNGYVVFCTVYVFGFSIAFSVIRNLGIIARQRGQVLAFFLAIIIALGWHFDESEDSTGKVSPPKRRPVVVGSRERERPELPSMRP